MGQRAKNLGSDMYIKEEESFDYQEILRRVVGFENHLTNLTKAISHLLSKTSEVQDKNEKFAKCLTKYKKTEKLETSSQYALEVAAQILSKTGDYEAAAIKRIESKVLPNLSTYSRICKSIQTDVKNAMKAQQRVSCKRKLAQTIKDKSSQGNARKFRSLLTDAQRDLENAVAESARLRMLSQEQIAKFEQKRLMDLKSSLEIYFRIQIAKHAKILNLFFEAYKCVQAISERNDVEIFKKSLRFKPSKLTVSVGHHTSTKSKNFKTSQKQTRKNKPEKLKPHWRNSPIKEISTEKESSSNELSDLANSGDEFEDISDEEVKLPRNKSRNHGNRAKGDGNHFLSEFAFANKTKNNSGTRKSESLKQDRKYDKKSSRSSGKKQDRESENHKRNAYSTTLLDHDGDFNEERQPGSQGSRRVTFNDACDDSSLSYNKSMKTEHWHPKEISHVTQYGKRSLVKSFI